MISGKEFVVFGVSLGFGLSYMIFKVSYEMAKNMADQDVAAIRDFMLKYHALVFLLYAALVIIHVLMLLVSRRFMKDPVKENFEKSGWLVNASGTLWLFVAISLIMALFDGFNFLRMWLEQPGEAVKFSCFFYWIYRVYNDPIPELSQIAVLWQLPMIIFEVLFWFFVQKRYYEAKRRFINLFPNVPRSGIYNAFHTLRKNGDRVHIEVPEDILSSTSEGSEDGISPVQKSLGSNSLFSVDPTPKEKTILKTQAEIDGEEGWFFGDGAVPPREAPAANTLSQAEEEAEQELIPTEFDFSKMKLDSSDTDSRDESEAEKVACPLCGYLNIKGSEECEFCGADMQ